MQPLEVCTSGCESGPVHRFAVAACLQLLAGFYNASMGSRQSASAGDAIEALRREIAQLEHELRRVRDGLERNPSHALEKRARQLRDNIALCKRDLAQESARNRSSAE